MPSIINTELEEKITHVHVNLTKLERQIIPFLHSSVARRDYYQNKTSPYALMESLVAGDIPYLLVALDSTQMAQLHKWL